MRNRHTAKLTEPLETQWYRQFWPWFLLVLLGSVVVASLITVAIAIVHGDNLVNDSYYRQGLAINQQLARDEMAVALDLKATLKIHNDLNISVSIDGDIHSTEQPQSLQVLWQHPTASIKDFQTNLERQSKNIYSAALEEYPSGRWYITLQPPTDIASTPQWRLKDEVFVSTALSNITKPAAAVRQSFTLGAR